MKDELIDIWQDPAVTIGELLLSKETDKLSPALAQVPLLSIVIAGFKTKRAWTDYLLAKKVQQFYTAWERLEPHERKQVYDRFRRKPRAFTEKLLYILAQQEDLAKCRLLGVLTTAYLQDTIKRADYLDLIETVAHLSMRDLTRLSKLFDQGIIVSQRQVGERYGALFVSRGLLLTEPRLPPEQRTSRTPFYRVTALGKVFIEQLHSVDL